MILLLKGWRLVYGGKGGTMNYIRVSASLGMIMWQLTVLREYSEAIEFDDVFSIAGCR